MKQGETSPTPELVGLIPLGGSAARIAPLPFSKELFPVGFAPLAGDDGLRPRPVCHYLLRQLRLAGIDKTYLVIRTGKWDIPAFLTDGAGLDLNLAFVVVSPTPGVPYTLDRGYPFVAGCRVAFGFADIILEPDDVFVRLDRRQRSSDADMVIAAFPAVDPSKCGMIDFDAEGRVLYMVEKPRRTTLKYTWGAAVWAPSFTEFLHARLHALEEIRDPDGLSSTREVNICDAVQGAIDAGLEVVVEVFEDGVCRDIGTPDDLIAAVRDYAMKAPRASGGTAQ
jgi:glucose-1-phosphate thymidylyltransferase